MPYALMRADPLSLFGWVSIFEPYFQLGIEFSVNENESDNAGFF
jgi:hypothetical protein